VPRQVAQREDVVPLLGEIFREHGFSGTSLSEITHRTGLGKSSLYHFFPNGKAEMAQVVLDDISEWFETHVYAQLRSGDDPADNIRLMFDSVDQYFDSGNRICLVGAFALDDTRDTFATQVNDYFTAWINALAKTLSRSGLTPREAKDAAEETVLGIQGALVLARSQDDSGVFKRALKRLHQHLQAR
jgi:AcrR family transcriptional regulator